MTTTSQSHKSSNNKQSKNNNDKNSNKANLNADSSTQTGSGNSSRSSGITVSVADTIPSSAHSEKQEATTEQQDCAVIALSERFYFDNKRKHNVKIQVKLNGDGIYLIRETGDESGRINEQLISIEDIIGSRCGPRLKKRLRGAGLSACKRSVADGNVEGEEDGTTAHQQKKQQVKDCSAYLHIYAYVKSEKPLRRNRTVRILRFRSADRYEENLKAAERWHQAIRNNKHRGNTTMASANSELSGNKQLLILLNPKSGSGKGREMFQKLVAPVLKEAEAAYELQVTMHANYAREFVRTRRDLLQRYNGIIVAAGDGLFYEVLNGLMERADWQSVCHKLPIGIIPCGSGNGLAKSIAHLYNEPYEPRPILNATLTCVSGKTALMDIVRVELANGKQQTAMYSFLSVGWGLIADVDIESERLRSIGAPRFTLWTIHRLISLRTYKGKLSYLLWTKEQDECKEEQPAATSAQQQQPQRDAHASGNVSNSNIPMPPPPPPLVFQEQFEDVSVADDGSGSDDNGDNEEFVDARSIMDGVSYRTQMDSWHSAVSRRTVYYSVAGQSSRSHRSATAGSVTSKISEANASIEMQSPASTIPPLGFPLPSDTWHSEEGEYVLVQAAYTTHLAADVLFAPESRLNDGIIHLVIIRAGVSRSQLLQFLLNMSTGTHLPQTPNEHIQLVPVRAFRIEPSGDEGIITVDGERVDYGAVQGEIFPSMINVMVPNAVAK